MINRLVSLDPVLVIGSSCPCGFWKVYHSFQGSGVMYGTGSDSKVFSKIRLERAKYFTNQGG